MGDKQSSAYKQQQETRRRAYVDTACLREEFPAVEQLVLQMEFVDPRGEGRHSPQTHTYSPAAKAFFSVACPSFMCLHGGFDLGPTISRMLARAVPESTGVATCQGWRGSARGEADRCRIEMRYKVSISYKDPDDPD